MSDRLRDACSASIAVPKSDATPKQFDRRRTPVGASSGFRLPDSASGKAAFWRRAISMTVAIAIAAGLAGCGTQQFDSESRSNVSQAESTTSSSPDSAPAQGSTPGPTQSRTVLQPTNAPQPKPTSDPAIPPQSDSSAPTFQPPEVTDFSASPTQFTSSPQTMTFQAHVKSGVAVSYVNFRWQTATAGDIVSGNLISGSKFDGTWRAVYIVDCHHFGSGPTLYVFPGAADEDGNTGGMSQQTISVVFTGTAINSPYDPSTNSKGSTEVPFVCQ